MPAWQVGLSGQNSSETKCWQTGNWDALSHTETQRHIYHLHKLRADTNKSNIQQINTSDNGQLKRT